MINLGIMKDFEAEPEMETQYNRFVDLFPECPVAEKAKQWLKFYSVKKAYDEQEEQR